MNMKKLSANCLLACGIITAICTTWTKVDETFFKKEVVESAPMISQEVKGLPPGTKFNKTMSVEMPKSEDVATTVALEAPYNYTWIIILASSSVAIGAGIIIRKKIANEVKKI